MNNPFAQPPQGQPAQAGGNPFTQQPQGQPQAPVQPPAQQPAGNPFGGAQGQPQPQQGPPQGQSSGKSLDDALSGGKAPGVFAKTDPVGTMYQGTVISHEIRQMRDPNTQKAKFWDDGNPQEQIAIRIQTNMRVDADDDGVRGVYVKLWGQNLDNLKEAIRNTGVEKPTQAITPGAILSVKFIEERPTQGFPEKIYAYHIQLPQPGQQVQFQQPQQPNQAMQVAQNHGWNQQQQQQQEPPF